MTQDPLTQDDGEQELAEVHALGVKTQVAFPELEEQVSMVQGLPSSHWTGVTTQEPLEGLQEAGWQASTELQVTFLG